MNIILMTSSFLPAIGGKEIVVHNLLRQYSMIGGLSSRLVRTGGLRYRLKHGFPYSYHSYPKCRSSPELSLKMALWLEKLCFGVDIIHLQGIYPLGKYLARLKDKVKFKLVLTPQGEDIQKLPALGYGFRLNPGIETEIKRVLETADAVTAISPIIRQDIESLGKTEITDIPNGVSVDDFSGQYGAGGIDEFRRRRGISKSTKVVLAVGRNHPKKGFVHLIRAIGTVKKCVQDIKLIIVGKGTESLKPIIRRNELDREVNLLGRVPRETTPFDARTFKAPDRELVYLYLMSDVFAMPSLIEGCPVVTIEAMAAGKPIVATNLGGSSDATGAVKDEENGFLVSPGAEDELADRLIRILKDRDLCARMGQRSKEIANSYDWPVVARRYIDVYRSILDK